MNQYKFFLIACIALLISCNSKTKTIKDTNSMIELGNLLESKFGSDAHYTKIRFIGSDTGVITNTIVTKDPKSLKMRNWNNSNGTWTQSEEITLGVPKGIKASDFMFQINKKVNFKLFGELVEKSINKIVTERGIKDVQIDLAYITSPSDGDFEKMTYDINVKPTNGGTTFRFSYKLDGTLNNLDY